MPGLLIDFSPIKSGGGAQLALNFVEYLSHERIPDIKLLISDKFPFASRLPGGVEVIVAPSSPVKRICFENVALRSYVKRNNVDNIFTFFGPGLPKYKGVRSTVSVAYPIVCYDDSPYWSYIGLREKIKKLLVNKARVYRLKRADSLIFETDVMKNRCVQRLGFDRDKCKVIPPVPTKFLEARDWDGHKQEAKSFLVLAGNSSHKNIWRLPEILPIADKEGLDFKIYISITRDEMLKGIRSSEVKNLTPLLDRYFVFLGAVQQDQIQKVYDSTDVVVNISDLESFSNNYMEAWISGKPVLSSDRDFARAILGESARYVEPHDVNSLFQGFKDFVTGAVDLEPMVLEGKRRLAQLPDMQTRFSQVIEVIREEGV